MLQDAACLEELAPRWRLLAQEVGVDAPFSLPEWALAWWRHLSRSSLLVEDRPLTFVAERQGELVAVAPMMITRRPGVGPLPMRCLQFIGTDPNLTELRGMLCHPEDEAEAQAAVLACATALGGWDWVLWSGVTTVRAWSALCGRRDAVHAEETPVYSLRLGTSWEAFRAGLSRNTKESLRKCMNDPKRDGIALSFSAEHEPARVAALLETFFALHSRRAQLPSRVPHGDVFASQPARRFLLDLCGRLGPGGQVRLFTVRHGDRVVAVRVGFVVGQHAYLYFSGFDPEYAKYSVMTRCIAETIRWSIEAGLQSVNLSTGRDVSKTRWGPQEEMVRAVALVPPSARAQAAYALLRAARQLRGRLGARRVIAPPAPVRTPKSAAP